MLVVFVPGDGQQRFASGCTAADRTLGTCGPTPINTGTRVDIEDQRSNPGGGGPRDPITDPGTFGPRPPTEEEILADCVDNWEARRCFLAREDQEPPEEAEEAAATPAITITDLAQFAPDPVTATGEPDNLGVAGMPTNFVAAASAHTQTGALFGTPLTVRFTPVGFDFRYGDGDTAARNTGGQTWTTLDQAPFTPTDTSHTYRERGTYDAGVTVHYTAEVDLGSGWFPIPGELTIDGPTQQIRIFEAHTALVARTCSEQPTAPGR